MGGHSRRAAYAGCRMIPYDRGADRLPNRAYWWRGTDSADRAPRRKLMLLQRRLAALLVVLALAGCAQGAMGQAGAPNAPNSSGNDEIRPEHGGGDGGGGGGGGM
jgi:hypothetical protein